MASAAKLFKLCTITAINEQLLIVKGELPRTPENSALHDTIGELAKFTSKKKPDRLFYQLSFVQVWNDALLELGLQGKAKKALALIEEELSRYDIVSLKCVNTIISCYASS